MPRGSHRPSLLTLVERAMVEHELARPGDLVLVACSGGPDSMALLHTLARVATRRRFRVAVHGIDHGLRAGASAELDLAERLAAKHELSFSRSAVTVEPGGNLQARARAVRHARLREVAAELGAASIATGHTADDRAETLVMRLVRGTGPRGLGVLPVRAGALIRPMIRARRADVLLHLERHDVPFATDPSNANPRFLRTRVRSEILPALERLSPQVVEALCGLSDAVLALDLPEHDTYVSRRKREQLDRASRREEMKKR